MFLLVRLYCYFYRIIYLLHLNGFPNYSLSWCLTCVHYSSPIGHFKQNIPFFCPINTFYWTFQSKTYLLLDISTKNIPSLSIRGILHHCTIFSCIKIPYTIFPLIHLVSLQLQQDLLFSHPKCTHLRLLSNDFCLLVLSS